ncbi:EVE domain-containing protein [Pseudarcicella hirudinis]|uniref:UPF0310 protein SAMN04515674_10468 n=1 Tax=Pseudarcicella hirudinis TaxID=1079859 RepID=A0A1I5RH78_9BACT|nr:EVE domain-containing protein [Pseudarcicella hirudinis]SFP57687.1 EVE domain-containing protein [Pseudarcicella hirudinis]
MRKPRYWIAVISKEHAMRGVSGGFIQVCHGKQIPLKRMSQDDWILIYSPKIKMDCPDKCQAFTGIGQLKGDDVYAFQMTEDFVPFRRNVEFYDCTETPILPLISQLDFIQNKQSWGYPFRFGILEIQENDFNLIFSKMLANGAH